MKVLVREVRVLGSGGAESCLPVRLRYGSEKLVTHYVHWQKVKSLKPVVPSKNIAAMSYSTRKLRPQKKTGRPPIGFRAAPNLRHGAVCHGPVSRVKVCKMNKKARKLAISTLLAKGYLAKESLILIDTEALPSRERVKDYLTAAEQLGVEVRDRVLYVVPSKEHYWKGLQNLPYHDCIAYCALNCRTIMRYHKVMICRELVDRGEERAGAVFKDEYELSGY